MRLPVCFLLILAAAAPAAARELRFHAYAYDLDSGAHRYTEVHRQTIEADRWVKGTVTYFAPDGSLIGTKTLDFGQDSFIPVYRMELTPGGGYVEGISGINAGTIELFRKRYGNREPETRAVARPEVVTADAGFHNLLRDRFDALMARETVRFHFAVASELNTFKFRARRIEDTTFEDKPAVQFLVEPATMLRLLAAPLYMIYDPATRQLVEYRGISNLHDPATGKAWTVRLVYPSKPPAEHASLPKEHR